MLVWKILERSRGDCTTDALAHALVFVHAAFFAHQPAAALTAMAPKKGGKDKKDKGKDKGGDASAEMTEKEVSLASQCGRKKCLLPA